MPYVNGVHLLPATGEFTYDTQPWTGQRVTETTAAALNTFAGGGSTTDFTLALDQLQADFPACTTVSLLVAWFGNSVDAESCQIYPSTTYIGGQFWNSAGAADHWRVSGLTEASSGLIALPQSGSTFVYGGTPSDQSIVRAIQAIKARGLRVVFYPFILMTAVGYPWRGRITVSEDMTVAAETAVSAFLGTVAVSEFSQDATNLTVNYSGTSTNYCFRRFILHYANLCALAGGVDLFLIGSELRGLETIRGTGWTKAGTTGSDGHAVWDYPFVDGLITLADDCRSVFDAAGLTKDLASLKNLITYSADWSVWMGVQHSGADGQWPHLDQLYASDNIDVVAFDNYLPLSDWTTGDGGRDVLNWSLPKPSTWPPEDPTSTGLGLTGTPTLKSVDYLKANIEGGEKYHWTYYDSDNAGRGLDPLGTGLQVSRPEGDRLTQTRTRYYAGQELLANKQIRWFWNNTHQAVYDSGDGAGWAPHGPATKWVAQSKSIIFTEYGFPTCDRATNQPNVFYDPKSSESFTPFWSAWESADGATWRPVSDDELTLLALQAVHEYWFEDGNNPSSSAGRPMIQQAFCCIWSWDARPFPIFPNGSATWGDAANWRAGNWLNGKGPFIALPVADDPPEPGTYPAFPTLAGQGWSVHFRPTFETTIGAHVSGRESRAARRANPQFEIELTFDVLRPADVETLVGFFVEMQGQDGLFTFPIPVSFGLSSETMTCRFADDQLDLKEFVSLLWSSQSVLLQTVRP